MRKRTSRGRSLSQARLLCKKGIIRQIVMDWEVQPNKKNEGLEETPNKKVGEEMPNIKTKEKR